jgi:protein gp37
MQKRAQSEGRRLKLFTCSLSDFFHRKADDWRPEAWEIIRWCRDVDFLVLTKRAHRIRECLPADWGNGYPNVWLGVSIGIMATAHRADKLRGIPAVIRFISAEPLLESIADALDLSGIHWLIAGGESGPRYRPMQLKWADELRDKCEKTSTVFFFKQIAATQSEQGEDALGKKYHNWPELQLLQIQEVN